MLGRVRDEISKAKASNTLLQVEIDRMSPDGGDAFDEGFAANWRAKRVAFYKEIEELPLNVETSGYEPERQL